MRVGPFATLLALGIADSLTAQGGAVASSSVTMGRDTTPLGRVERALPFATLAGFVSNAGQWDAEVLFHAEQNGIGATLTRDALVFVPARDPEATDPAPGPLVLRLPGATAVEGQGILPTPHHFLLETGTTSWVPGFAQVIYRDVAPGIDLVVRTDGESFAYDVHVAAGAELADLVLEIDGSDGLEVRDGTLVMSTPAGCIEQRLGAAWDIEPESGAQRPVASRFKVLDGLANGLRFGFEAPDRNPGRAFVLDPSLVWSTYVGGVNQDQVEEMDVTPDGSVYLAVRSNSTGPTTPGSFQPVKPGGSNAWVGKLSSDGATLEWGTFVGGSDVEEVAGIDVDADGTVVVVGHTWSSDFPTTPGSLQPSFAGALGRSDIFATRLTPDGSGLVWSTFYGALEYDEAVCSALMPSGDLVIAGRPSPTPPVPNPPPPATPGAFDTVYDTGDQMLVRLSADGTQLVFQTFFGSGFISDIECDDPAAIVFGGSAGASLPTTRGAFQQSLAQGDSGSGFVAKMNSLGSQLLWATFLGGDELTDHVSGLAVDEAGCIHVAGQTLSDDFPVTAGAFDTTSSSDGSDGFVAKLLPGGTDLVWSTYISACGGGAASLQWDIAVDTAGNAISVGSSNEPNFPTTPDAFQPTYIGGFPASDAHLTKFDAFGEALVYSTYFGGGSSDNLPFVGLDVAQDPYIAVRSSSSDVPVTPGAYDTTNAGSTDTVVAKFDLVLLPWEVLGGGLVGAIDTPNLAGTGLLIPATPARLSVRGAAPSASAWLITGASALYLPLKGGTLVPAPTIIVPLATNAQGGLDLPFTWVNVPAGINLYVQVWIKDPGAPTGFSATNALRMTSQ